MRSLTIAVSAAVSLLAASTRADDGITSGPEIGKKVPALKVYAVTGFLCGLAGVIDIARFGTENLSAHNSDNLNAIAAVVIGGTSLFGGVGTILGSVVGAFIPTVLQNGFVISQVDPFWQEVLVGATIIVAVYIDQVRRRRLLT